MITAITNKTTVAVNDNMVKSTLNAELCTSPHILLHARISGQGVCLHQHRVDDGRQLSKLKTEEQC